MPSSVSPAATTWVTGVAVAVGEAMMTGVAAGVCEAAGASGRVAVAGGRDNKTAVGTMVGAGAAWQPDRARANIRSKGRQSVRVDHKIGTGRSRPDQSVRYLSDRRSGPLRPTRQGGRKSHYSLEAV